MNDCDFCRIANGTEKASVVSETENTIAFFDINPMNPYHTLVIPKSHFRDIFDIPSEILSEVILSVKRISNIYKDTLGINQIQILNSNGSTAQQDVFHFHFHIAPRFEGDGQAIHWEIRHELKDCFDEMLEKVVKK